MLKSVPFANAATTVTAVFYVICAVASYVAPDLVVSIGNSWVHSLDLEMIKVVNGMSIGTLTIGLITISAVTWVTTYAMIKLYNRWAK